MCIIDPSRGYVGEGVVSCVELDFSSANVRNEIMHAFTAPPPLKPCKVFKFLNYSVVTESSFQECVKVFSPHLNTLFRRWDEKKWPCTYIVCIQYSNNKRLKL